MSDSPEAAEMLLLELPDQSVRFCKLVKNYSLREKRFKIIDEGTEKTLIKVDILCKRLGIWPKEVQKLRRNYYLPSYKIGMRRYYCWNEILRWAQRLACIADGWDEQ